MLQRISLTRVDGARSTMEEYWLLQVFGWSALAVVSFLSLTLWYNPGEWQPAAHTVLQSALGLVVSHPLRWVSSSLWYARPIRRVSLIGISVVVAALIWTSLRLLTFTWLTGEVVAIVDYGGWAFASLIVFGAWAFCYHALRYYRQATEQRELTLAAQETALRQRERAREAEFKALRTEAEFTQAKIRMLKYQLNPHFLFNALNSVTYLVRKNDQRRAEAMLGKIGAFLRISLEDDESLQHSLAEELEIVHLYLDIERERFGDRLYTEFQISPESQQVNVPTFLLQPLVENTLKHAVGASLDRVTISLRAHVEDDQLAVTISDNGPGFSDGMPDPENPTGIGLKNVRDRLSTVYGSSFSLTFSNAKPSGAVIELRLPLADPAGETPLLRPPSAPSAEKC